MFELRTYQKQAVDAVVQFFKRRQEPAVVVLPTGAGKSLVIAEMARIARGRVLVLAHVKELVEQNHQKYESYQLQAGIYSAGLQSKDSSQKVIFGSIQSVARAEDSFFNDFSLLIIDECHRVSLDEETQYATVIKRLKQNNPKLCVLGLTATPYRLGLGWIFNENQKGEIVTEEPRFFRRCVFELPIDYMIRNRYLCPPVKIDIPVTSYDFSALKVQPDRMYSLKQIEEILKSQRQLTPLIIQNIVDIAERYQRKGVMIFSSSVKHAREIMSFLPEGEAKLVIGETEGAERDSIIEEFKQQKFKYLVNVSVLTTGFDAPHVDVIAIMRPTESVSLYQQIVGRGLRLHPGKRDCFILDYTGMGHDIYSPEVREKRPSEESVLVPVECPKCGFENQFWGLVNDDGEMIEHYGRKCRGASLDELTFEMTACGYRFRFKLCPSCGEENDLTARNCHGCDAQLTDAEAKLKQARLSKNALIFRPDFAQFEERVDKNGNPFLQVKYFDCDAKYLAEYHYLNNSSSLKKFHINFLRSHIRRPELEVEFDQIEQVIRYQKLFRVPSFIIARKKDQFWKITEKIFTEEL